MQNTLLRPFWDEWLPKMLSKSMVPLRTSIKMSQKTSRASLGGMRGSGQLLASRGQLCRALGVSAEVLGELGEACGSSGRLSIYPNSRSTAPADVMF